MKPIVALVGRPNVGKSTLFNRIIQKKDALVDDFPGVTRDRHYSEANWNGVEFTLVDTGGFTEDDEDRFAGKIRHQVRQAIDDADVVVLLLDGKAGVSPYDDEMISIARKLHQPVFYVVNKVDGWEQESRIVDFYNLGIGKLYSVSAEHGYGVPDFLDELIKRIPDTETETEEGIVSLAVIGRPNAGKSSLINKLLGEERLLVSDVPGTTRDAVDSFCSVGGKRYRLIDTAGIRRKSKVKRKLEKFSVIKALRSLERCDVALIVLDAAAGISEQDIRIAGYAFERGCGCIFLLNKWDIVEKEPKTHRRFVDQLRHEAKFLSFAPVLTVSALTGRRLPKIFSLVDMVYAQYSTRIGTGQVNRIIEQAVVRTEPSLHKGKRLKFYYATQIAAKPPTFVCFVNYPEAVHFSYRRYLTNQIREHTGLDQTPIRIQYKLRTGRIDFGRKKRSGRRKKK